MAYIDGKEWYAKYLESPHWIAVRDRALAAANHRCQRCGEWGRRDINGRWLGLHVHHFTYERVGAELPDDLQVLCIACHEETHGREVTAARREQIRRKVIGSAAAPGAVTEPFEDDITIEQEYIDRLIEEGYDL